MENASFSEIIQVVAASIGACLALRPMLNAERNRVAVIREGFSGDRLLFADWLCGKTRTTFWIQILMAFGGLATWRLAPPPWALEFVATTGEAQRQLIVEARASMVVSRLILFGVSIALMRLSYKSWIALPRLTRRREMDDRRESPAGTGDCNVTRTPL